MICFRCQADVPDDARQCPYRGADPQGEMTPQEITQPFEDDGPTEALFHKAAPDNSEDVTRDPALDADPKAVVQSAEDAFSAAAAQTPRKARRAVILVLVFAIVAVGAVTAYLALKDRFKTYREESAKAASEDTMEHAIALCVDALNSNADGIPDAVRPEDELLLAVFSALKESDNALLSAVFRLALPSGADGSGTISAYWKIAEQAFRKTKAQTPLDPGNYSDSDNRTYALLPAYFNGQTVSYEGRSFHIDTVRVIEIAGDAPVLMVLAQVDGHWTVFLARR